MFLRVWFTFWNSKPSSYSSTNYICRDTHTMTIELMRSENSGRSTDCFVPIRVFSSSIAVRSFTRIQDFRAKKRWGQHCHGCSTVFLPFPAKTSARGHCISFSFVDRATRIIFFFFFFYCNLCSLNGKIQSNTVPAGGETRKALTGNAKITAWNQQGASN